MANNILTIDMITRKGLSILHNKLGIVSRCNRQYDKSFAQTGAKIGATLRIRKPNRYVVTKGAALVIQDENEQNTSLTVSNQVHVGLNFTSAELTMGMDDFSQRVLEPAMSQLAAYIDNDVANAFTGIGQSVGTPGTTPGTSLVLLQGNQKLDEAAVSRDRRYAVVNPAANAQLVEGLKGLFNPGDVLDRQFKAGLMGTGVLGFSEIAMSQSVSSLTTGTRTNGTVSVTSVQGDTTIVLTGLGANATVAAGDVFTVAGTNAINPQTRLSTGSLYQFVATAAATASGAGVATVTVQATIYDKTSALGIVDVLPASTSVVTFSGAASTAYPQNLIFHPDAIAFATADLYLPTKGVEMAGRAVHEGISLRIIKQFDGVNDREITRADVLYGYSVIRPEMACRLWG